MKDEAALGVSVVVTLLIMALLIWGAYVLNRKMNWSLGYEDMVEQKIQELVKEEALK